MERNSADITSLGARGSWCAFQDSWTSVRTITYDRLTHSDTNMNVGSPLNRYTGINSHKCYYYLDIDIWNILGIFTVPVSGAWRMSFSLWDWVNTGDQNYCYFHINGQALYELRHNTYTYSSTATGVVHSSGGRVVTVDARAGDKIEIRATVMDFRYFNIMYCAEYIPKLWNCKFTSNK